MSRAIPLPPLWAFGYVTGYLYLPYWDMEVLPSVSYCSGRLVPSFLSSKVRNRQRTSDVTYSFSFQFVVRFSSCRKPTELALRRLSTLLSEELRKKAMQASNGKLSQFYGCTSLCLFSPVF
jgi:hypothetical protein